MWHSGKTSFQILLAKVQLPSPSKLLWMRNASQVQEWLSLELVSQPYLDLRGQGLSCSNRGTSHILPWPHSSDTLVCKSHPKEVHSSWSSCPSELDRTGKQLLIAIPCPPGCRGPFGSWAMFHEPCFMPTVHGNVVTILPVAWWALASHPITSTLSDIFWKISLPCVVLVPLELWFCPSNFPGSCEEIAQVSCRGWSHGRTTESHPESNPGFPGIYSIWIPSCGLGSAVFARKSYAALATRVCPLRCAVLPATVVRGTSRSETWSGGSTLTAPLPCKTRGSSGLAYCAL